jgi:hypothetical protein
LFHPRFVPEAGQLAGGRAFSLQPSVAEVRLLKVVLWLEAADALVRLAGGEFSDSA